MSGPGRVQALRLRLTVKTLYKFVFTTLFTVCKIIITFLEF